MTLWFVGASSVTGSTTRYLPVGLFVLQKLKSNQHFAHTDIYGPMCFACPVGGAILEVHAAKICQPAISLNYAVDIMFFLFFYILKYGFYVCGGSYSQKSNLLSG